MISLPANLLASAQKVTGPSPWIHLLEFEIDRTTTNLTLLAITNVPESITFGGVTYLPFPFALGEIEIAGDGSMPSFDLAVSNVTRELSNYLEIGAGFIGRSVTLRIVHRDYLATSTDRFQMTFQISGAAETADSIVFRVELPNYFQHSIPAQFYSLDTCPWVYKGTECGSRGPDSSCLKTLADCIDKGNDEVLLGYPRMHPRRFGAFAGIPRNIR